MKIFRDLSKEHIIEKFTDLYRIAGNFSNLQKTGQEFQVITVGWIGYQLTWLFDPEIKQKYEYCELIYPELFCLTCSG